MILLWINCFLSQKVTKRKQITDIAWKKKMEKYRNPIILALLIGQEAIDTLFIIDSDEDHQ